MNHLLTHSMLLRDHMYGYIFIIFLDIFCIYTLWTDDLRLIFERIDAYVFI